MKSEPATYSVDDLARRCKPDIWEGCRNYTVRNFFRDRMNAGDLSFFYHSSCPEPGIVGVMRIVGDAYADPTQFDPKSNYFDAKSPQDNPRWLARDVVLVAKFSRVITLPELRATPGLEGMEVLRRGQRLSVLPVTADEWAIVTRLAGFQSPA